MNRNNDVTFGRLRSAMEIAGLESGCYDCPIADRQLRWHRARFSAGVCRGPGRRCYRELLRVRLAIWDESASTVTDR